MTDIPYTDDREQGLLEAVMSLAESFRDERDRLARRLTQLEREIGALAVRLDQHQRELPETARPASPPPDPSRTPS
jgi:hypothetical protein